MMTPARSKRIIAGLKKFYGAPRPSLAYRGLYELSVSVILSAQTTDSQVNGVTPALFARYPDFASLARAGIRDVERLVRSTGFYRNKAKNIIGMARAVIKDHGGRMPETLDELILLPGIGRKSANVILSMGLGVPALAVDTHVMRVARRLGYTSAQGPFEVERALTAFIPRREWSSAHLLLITHGRRTCRARAPLHGECPVRRLCDAVKNTP